jgi:hypothetical protein
MWKSEGMWKSECVRLYSFLPFLIYASFYLYLALNIARQVEELMHEYQRKGVPVAGVVVEPIQSEGGDYHGSNEFFVRLQATAKKVSVSIRFFSKNIVTLVHVVISQTV